MPAKYFKPTNQIKAESANQVVEVVYRPRRRQLVSFPDRIFRALPLGEREKLSGRARD